MGYHATPFYTQMAMSAMFPGAKSLGIASLLATQLLVPWTDDWWCDPECTEATTDSRIHTRSKTLTIYHQSHFNYHIDALTFHINIINSLNTVWSITGHAPRGIPKKITHAKLLNVGNGGMGWLLNIIHTDSGSFPHSLRFAPIQWSINTPIQCASPW